MRNRKLALSLISISLLLFALSNVAAPITQAAQAEPTCPTTITPSNPKASPAAQRVLSFLWELPTRANNRVLAGQFGSYGDGAGVPEAQARLQKIFDQTGKWVGLTGMDYKNWDVNHAGNLSIPNSFLIEQWGKGSIVTLSWHPINPWTSGESNDWEYPKGSVNTPPILELITPATQVHARWQVILEDTAKGLQELEDNGVVVIFRPFHEMNGEWFWWSRQTQADFSAVWQYLVNYFTVEKGLDNILWGFSPNSNSGKDARRATYYWPGDAFVDVVGLDKYMKLGETPLTLDAWGDYTDLVKTCKPVGIFEFGPTPASAWPDSPRYDFVRLIRDIQRYYPRVAFFQVWEWHWAIGENRNAKALLNDPWIVTQDELPAWDAES
jgi:mannan endo-1,4-beta-mannosidase